MKYISRRLFYQCSPLITILNIFRENNCSLNTLAFFQAKYIYKKKKKKKKQLSSGFYHSSKVIKLATVVEGDAKAPFSIATTLSRRGMGLSFPCSTLPLIRILRCWVFSKKYKVKFFESSVRLDQRVNPGLPGHWRTLYSIGYTQVTSYQRLKNWCLILVIQWILPFQQSYKVGDRTGRRHEGSLFNCYYPGHVIPKTQKLVLDTALVKTQHYKVKQEQSKEGSRSFAYTWVQQLLKRDSESPLITVANFSVKINKTKR